MPEDATDIPLDASPGDRIALAVARFGEADVADRAVALLTGHNEGADFLLWVGGRHAKGILDGAPALYWPEVWGARTLLYAWEPAASSAVQAGLSNQAWRVREMCARVVAARNLAFASELSTLLGDEVPRVRANAARALGFVGGSEDAEALRRALTDPEIDVRRQAGAALKQLAERTGRPLS